MGIKPIQTAAKVLSPWLLVCVTPWCCHALALISRDLFNVCLSEEIIASTVEKMEKNEHLLENQGFLVSPVAVPAFCQIRYMIVSFLPAELLGS